MTYDGIHQVDLARWLCNLTYPKSVYSHGARYDREGAAETPDTQLAVLEFDNLMMSFELTLNTPYMLKSDTGVRDGDIYPYWPQNTERIEIYGTDGVMYVGRMGARVAGLCPAQGSAAGAPRSVARQVPPTNRTRRISCSASAAANDPTPTSKPATSARCWSITR